MGNRVGYRFWCQAYRYVYWHLQVMLTSAYAVGSCLRVRVSVVPMVA